MATKRQLIFYWINLHRGTWARVNINGIPLYRMPFVGPHSRSGPLNYLLMPGENEIEIELLKTAKPNPYENETTHVNDAIKFHLYIVNNPDAADTVKLDKTMLMELEYPKIWEVSEDKAQQFPFYYRQKFQLDQNLAKPPFVDAPPVEFECEGNHELRTAVQNLHEMLEKQDYHSLLDELSFKFHCDELACEGEDGQRASVKMNQWLTEMLPYEPVPSEPLDMSLLHFEMCRGGRVAYVTRHDEGYPLDAVCRKDPKRRIRTDLLMMQHQGRWRVFA